MRTRNLLSRSVPGVLLAVTVLLLGALPATAAGPLTLTRTIPIPSLTHDIELQGQFMYVATNNGLTVVDMSTPASPFIRGSVTTTSVNMGVRIRGQYAYLASFGGGLRVVDISNPDAPVIVATRAAGYAYEVGFKDNIAYVISFAGEVFVYDITNPTNPTLVRTLGLPAWKLGDAGLPALNSGAASGNAKGSVLIVKGNVMLATDWGYGRIYYWDVSTPASPVFRGTHYAPYVLKVDVDLDNDVIYMLSAYLSQSGIYTVPLSYLHPNTATTHPCPVCGYVASTVPIVGLDPGGMALGAGGDYLVYGGGRNNGEFNVVDVSDPLAMTTVATRPIGPHLVLLSHIMGVRTDGDVIYFAAGDLGIQVYSFPGLSGAASPPPPSTSATVATFGINSGALSTTNRVVTLNNTVNGTATQYRAGESSNLTALPWLAYGAAPAFTLTGANGAKQVFLQVRGADLVASPTVSDSITLNEPVPNVTLFAINAGAGTTTTRTVTLNNTTTNNPTHYRASEVVTFDGASWLPYAAAPSFQLSAGADTKRVYFQTKNAAGQSTSRSDTIILSVPTPVLKTLAINAGATTTTSRTVTLNNTTSGAAPTHYRASESSAFTGAAWLPYSTAPSFDLSAGNATKRVYFQLRDAEGAISNFLSDTIVLSQ